MALPKKTKVLRQWIHPLNGSRNIAEIRVGKRGTEYFCLYLPAQPDPLTGIQGRDHLRPVKDLRVSALKDAAVWIAGLAETNQVPEEWLESLLDFIYAELNRRLNKVEE